MRTIPPERLPASLLCLVLLAAACVTPLWEADGRRWYKKGASHDEFRQDVAACQAQASPTAAGDAVTDCLLARGYQFVPGPSPVDRARDTFPSEP